MRACDCDKLIEIQKLRDKISTMKNECETRDILCSSLTEETNTIKQQLHDIAGHCQQLAVKLERSEKSKVSMDIFLCNLMYRPSKMN
jgi:chromosome segregation ATPase